MASPCVPSSCPCHTSVFDRKALLPIGDENVARFPYLPLPHHLHAQALREKPHLRVKIGHLLRRPPPHTKEDNEPYLKHRSLERVEHRLSCVFKDPARRDMIRTAEAKSAFGEQLADVHVLITTASGGQIDMCIQRTAEKEKRQHESMPSGRKYPFLPFQSLFELQDDYNLWTFADDMTTTTFSH